MAQSDADWKQKYLSNLDRLEKMEQRWNSVEDLLRMGITRVAVAAQGVDAQLDKHLNSLRNTIRSGKNYPDLESIVERISDTVKRLDQERSEEPRVNEENPLQLIIRLLESIDFPQRSKKQAKTLLDTLKKTSAAIPVEEFLRNTAVLIQDALCEPGGGRTDSLNTKENDTSTGDNNPGENRGIFGRLFGGQEKPRSLPIQEATVAVAQQLQWLVDNLPFSIPDMTKEQLKNQLSEARRMDEIRGPLQALNAELKQQAAIGVQSGDNAMAICIAQLDCGRRLSLQLLDLLKEAGVSALEYQSMRDQLRLADTEEAIFNLVERFVALIAPTAVQERQPAREAPGSMPVPASIAKNYQTDISQFCLKLLESLNFSESDAPSLSQIREQLLGGIDLGEFPQVLVKIADLVSLSRRRIEKEKRELQEFLRQLTERLKDIDQHLEGAESKRVAVEFSSQRFGDAVEAHVNHLQSSVQQAAELGQLKSLIQERVDAIRTHLVSHREEQNARQQQLEQELTASNTRLKAMETETRQLRERLNQEHTQAIRDALTGVNNRLAYEERMEQEYARWRRYHKPLALLIFDIDHFKTINDSYGHKAGDKALKLIANCLQRNLRESDFLARYGGEEFVVLMPETDVNAALGAANKLREAVQENHFHYQEKDVRITVSCGVAYFKDNDTPETTFQRADQSLYYCKQHGRNRCYSQDL